MSEASVGRWLALAQRSLAGTFSRRRRHSGDAAAAAGGRLGASTMAPSRINARGPSDDRRSVFSLRRANPIFSVDECSVCSQLIELYCICCDGAGRSGLNESLIAACIAMWRDVSSPPSI